MASYLLCGFRQYNGTRYKLVLSLESHIGRPSGERAPLIGAETDAFGTTELEGDEGESEPEVSRTEKVIE